MNPLVVFVLVAETVLFLAWAFVAFRTLIRLNANGGWPRGWGLSACRRPSPPSAISPGAGSCRMTG